jgi:hypothetical protein
LTVAPPITDSAVELLESTWRPQLFRFTAAPFPALNA